MENVVCRSSWLFFHIFFTEDLNSTGDFFGCHTSGFHPWRCSSQRQKSDGQPPQETRFHPIIVPNYEIDMHEKAKRPPIHPHDS